MKLYEPQPLNPAGHHCRISSSIAIVNDLCLFLFVPIPDCGNYCHAWIISQGPNLQRTGRWKASASFTSVVGAVTLPLVTNCTEGLSLDTESVLILNSQEGKNGIWLSRHSHDVVSEGIRNPRIGLSDELTPASLVS